MMMDNSIQKGLERDALLEKERIPDDMTRSNAQQKAESLKRFMERHDYTQVKVAKALGVSDTQISQFLGGKYKGDVKTLVIKIVELINTVDRRTRSVRKQPFIDTTIARKIFTIIKHTRAFSNDNEGVISTIIGDSGHGKTVCLRQYAEVNKNAFYVLLDNAMNSTRVFGEIAKQIKVDEDGSMNNITRRIIDNLQNREAVIMIDEASYLTVRQLSQLRTVIVDQARCALVLAGNSDLLKTIQQNKTKRGCESLDQFRSRLLTVLNLDVIASQKDGGLYTVEDVRKLYASGGITLTFDAISTFRKISKTPQSGRLRTCGRIVAAIYLGGKFKKIDADLILKVIEELDLPVQAYMPVVIRDHTGEQQEKTAAAKAG